MNRRQFLHLAGVALLGPSLLTQSPPASGPLECIYEIDHRLLYCTRDPQAIRAIEDHFIVQDMEQVILDENCTPLHWEARQIGPVWLKDADGKTYLAERRIIRHFYAGKRRLKE